MKRIYLILISILALSAFSCEDGEDGMDGPQGPAGQDGNANVSSYSFSVNRQDWGDNLHYGESNIFRAFNIPSDLIGGYDMSSVIAQGGAVLLYSDGGVINRQTAIPFSFTYEGIGIKLNAAINSNDLLISKTTNGYDNVAISLNEIPEEIRFIIVLIPNEIQEKMNDQKIDLTNYQAVANYFNLPDYIK